MNRHELQEELAGHKRGSPSPNNSATPLAARSPAKRILDISVAIVGLLLSVPLWVLAALLIKAEDGGPVFYRQLRYGKNGESFRLTKFRTMQVHSEDRGIRQATKHDSRVTRFGSFLRATGMDELPQLWNILVGDMSFVGPRALAVGESMRRSDGTLIAFEDLVGFRERLTVKPGLTGLATVLLPKDADPMEKLSYDVRYIREYSLWLDISLIVTSLWRSFRGRWKSHESIHNPGN